MPYNDLRDFLRVLEEKGELIRVRVEVDPYLEVSEILNRLLAVEGPAVIFERLKGHRVPVVANLFGTLRRVTLGLETDLSGLYEIGKSFADLQHPEPPEGLLEAIKKLPFYKRIMDYAPKVIKRAPCQEVVIEGEGIDLKKFPILHCWPGDVASLITWPLVITKGPEGGPINVGVYRMQVISKNRTLIRWLRQRGGAQHYYRWMSEEKPMPVAVAIGNEPATIISAVAPIPDYISEFYFAGLLRKRAIEVVPCKTIDLMVPATSEIVLEGEVLPGETMMEGPFGDHTGYYNPPAPAPVFRIKCITHRIEPLYLATITGRPPHEDAVIAIALTRMFLPILKGFFPEVVDFNLPMEAVSYRLAVVSIKKEYPGHPKRVMMGLLSLLRQFLFIKFIIVVDPDIDVHKWKDVIWALATRVDPSRDTTIIENVPIDDLDFASPIPGLGSKMGIDATMKAPPEVNREWGKKMEMSPEVMERVNRMWRELGITLDKGDEKR